MAKSKEPVDTSWVGPKEMTEQLAIFCEAYRTAYGRERSYRAAAIKAGVKPKSAAQMGYKWSRYSVVKQYFEDMKKAIMTSHTLRYESGLNRLEEIAYDEETSKADAIVASDLLCKHIETLKDIDDKFGSDSSATDSDNTGVGNNDKSTENTLGQILISINEIAKHSNNTAD